MTTLAGIQSQIRDLARRVSMLFARGNIAGVDDGGGLQGLALNVLAGEDRDQAQRIGEAGFFSVPLEGAVGLLVSFGGDRSQSLVIATDDRRYRPRDGAPGDVGIVHPRDDSSLAAEDALARLTFTERNGETWLYLRCDHFDVRCGSSHFLVEDGRIRMDATRVETRAGENWQVDVNGYGWNWVYNVSSAKWREDLYKTTTEIEPGTENPVDPPEHSG